MPTRMKHCPPVRPPAYAQRPYAPTCIALFAHLHTAQCPYSIAPLCARLHSAHCPCLPTFILRSAPMCPPTCMTPSRLRLRRCDLPTSIRLERSTARCVALGSAVVSASGDHSRTTGAVPQLASAVSKGCTCTSGGWGSKALVLFAVRKVERLKSKGRGQHRRVRVCCVIASKRADRK